MLHLSARILKVWQQFVSVMWKKIARSQCQNKNCKRMAVKVYTWLTSFIYDVCHMERAKHTHFILLADMPTGKEKTCHRIRKHVHKNILSSVKNGMSSFLYDPYNCSFFSIFTNNFFNLQNQYNNNQLIKRIKLLLHQITFLYLWDRK